MHNIVTLIIIFFLGDNLKEALPKSKVSAPVPIYCLK